MDKVLASGLGASTQMAMIPESAIQTSGRIGSMVFGIFMLAALPEATRQSAKIARSIEDMLRSEGAWIPTVVLAQEAGNQLDSSGLYKVIVTDTLYEYPGLTDREATWHLQNWTKPMGHWYQQEVSPFDYSSFKDQDIDAVLEVSIMLYGIDYALVAGGSLKILVYIKLIDAATGKGLGRAKNDEDFFGVRTGPLEKLFENNGEGFKRLFNTLARKIIRKELQYLIMLPRSE
jgi:hypothetical protein